MVIKKGFLLKLAGRIPGNSGILYLTWCSGYNKRIPKVAKSIQKNRKSKKKKLDLIMNKSFDHIFIIYALLMNTCS